MQKKKENDFFSQPWSVGILCFIVAITVINQGGYFPGGIVLAGLLISFMFIKAKLHISMFDAAFLFFSVWYVFCAILPGFDVDYTARALIPLIAFVFRLMLEKNSDNSGVLLDCVIKFSLVVAVCAIVMCLASTFSEMRLQRLAFPLQYANSSGIYFGVLFILSGYGESDKQRKYRSVFLIALILTQSVGAIALTIIAEIVLAKNLKKTIAIAVLLVIGGLLLKNRIIQSMGTFIERLLHIHDGFICMIKNPVFGIGAGRWAVHKQIYQTGFYSTVEIHSSIMSIGASSGVIGLLLFFCMVVCGISFIKFENRSHLICAIMIMVHSLFDFSFAFLGIALLLMVILAQGNEKACGNIKVDNIIVKGIASACLALIFIMLASGLSQIKSFEKKIALADYNSASKDYENSFFLKHSSEATSEYIRALQALGEKDKFIKLLDGIDVLPPDIIISKLTCYNDWRGVLDYLKEQPYNTYLYEAVESCDDYEVRNEAKEMLSEAIESMSCLGEKLYEIEGGKL